MFCKDCGEDNRNDRKFCSNCGAKLRDYTKPRENLVMADEVLKENKKEQRLKKLNIMFVVLMCVFFAIGVGFTIATFFTEGNLQFGVTVTSISFYIVYLLTWIAKIITNKLIKREDD